jgi:hypothetical protein
MSDDRPSTGTDGAPPTPSLLETIGTHPLGTVLGVIGGAFAGLFPGVAAGPVGSLAGAIGGALISGALGASTTVGPAIDVSREDRHWRKHYIARPYVPPEAYYADDGPAYRYGVRGFMQASPPRDWNSAEPGLARGWETSKETSRLAWEDARPAARDAWERLRDAR